MNEEVDRLSNLPDELIHKILSFISIKNAIITSSLSSRWRFIWTSLPYVNFSTKDFQTLLMFSKFVSHVLSTRNNQIQQMRFTCLLENNSIEFPLSFLCSKSLKHLSITTESRGPYRRPCDRILIIPMSTWELPALTTLCLHGVNLCDDNVDLFSKCANLRNLTLQRFKTMGANGFSICHPQLSSLTLEDGFESVQFVNVVAPQLENLTIINWPRKCKHVVSAPNLASVVYKGFHPLQLISTDSFHSLEKVNLCVSNPEDAGAHNMLCLLQQVHSVKYLTLNLEIVELFSSSLELISHHPPPFVNLKNLNIYPERVSEWEISRKKVKMCTQVLNYFLGSSPGATFTMVSREEAMVVKNVKSTQKLITELHAHLEKEKAETKSSETQMQLQIEGNMAQIKSCWDDMGVQFGEKKAKVEHIILNLQCIEKLIRKLPESKRVKIQSCFSSLCEQAQIVISQTTNCMKIQLDENQSRLSVCFHKLAATLQTP